MHFVHDEVVKRLNEGKWFEEIYHEMLEIYPEKFKKHEILKGTYGCYRFAIHATYRLYHGWYNSGNPTDLFPSKTSDVAREFLKLNSEKAYIEHANKLYSDGKKQLALHVLDIGKKQLALHVLDIVIKGSEEEKKETLVDALELKVKILKEKVKNETSFIAGNIIDDGIYQIKERLKELNSNKLI